MNQNRKRGMPEINRQLYKDVKRYDRQQFTQFCTNLYKYGFEDGQETVSCVDLEAIYSAIDGVKGIGPKTSEKVKEALENLFRKNREGENE